MTEGWILFGCLGNVGGVALSRDGKNGGKEGREEGKKGGEGEGHQVGFRGEVILLGLLEWELGALCRMSDCGDLDVMLGLSPGIAGLRIGVLCRTGGDTWGRGVDEGRRAAGDLVPTCFTGESGDWSMRGNGSEYTSAMNFRFILLLKNNHNTTI